MSRPVLWSRGTQAASTWARHQLTAPHVVLTRSVASAAVAPSPSIGEDPSSGSAPAPIKQSTRRELLKDAKPFSDFLTDNFHRQHNYLRISLTERCNLRCVYCMPEEGVPLSPQKELLTTPEIIMLSSVFVSQGVNKIRLTGGEPTVRRDILPLMQQLGALRTYGLRELCLTTNGLVLHRKLEGMVEAGLTGVNLSLDTLDPWQFQIMTRRKGFDSVMKSIDRIFELNKHGAGIKLKINCVVMRGINDRDILPFVEMTREKDLEVRFIEYMPFDGNKWNREKMVDYAEMLNLIRTKYPSLRKVQDHKNDTSKTWEIPGFVGRLGFITSMTHNFCGTCNRLRITSDGNLKVCLFGNAEVSLRDILRKSNKGEPIDQGTFEAIKKAKLNVRRELTGTDQPLSLSPNEQELLSVIGMAVKRKKERHAGIGELEHMQNRPMILIARLVAFTRAKRSVSWRQNSIPIRPAVPFYLLPQNIDYGRSVRMFSSSTRQESDRRKLTHVSESGSARMVSISDKSPTKRVAKAVCSVIFSDETAINLIKQNQMKKGDVLGVARIAGIMAAKRTSDLIPLCHPISISQVVVQLAPSERQSGQHATPHAQRYRIDIEATVSCEGKTGVEMEALTAASTAALTVYDMCKAVDKRMAIEGLRVILKEGGKSGTFVEGYKKEGANTKRRGGEPP